MTLHLDALAAAPGGAAVLHDVALTVPTGTCTSVLGPSGAGKTTLLRAITGLEPPTAGTVGLDGEAITDLPVDQRQISVVFQDARLFPSMDVAANVGFPLRMAGRATEAIAAEVDEALHAVGLPGFGTRHVRTLSGGEQQRVALARALVGTPRLLLLDEPFAAVDPDRRDELRDLVDRLRRERGLTTVLVTHDRDDAAILGDRIAVLLGGSIAQEGPVREVLERPLTQAVAEFVGCDVILPIPTGMVVARPEQVGLQVTAGPPTAGPPNAGPWSETGPWSAVVNDVTLASDHARVTLKVAASPPTIVTVRVPTTTAPVAGDHVTFALPNAWKLP